MVGPLKEYIFFYGIGNRSLLKLCKCSHFYNIAREVSLNVEIISRIIFYYYYFKSLDTGSGADSGGGGYMKLKIRYILREAFQKKHTFLADMCAKS